MAHKGKRWLWVLLTTIVIIVVVALCAIEYANGVVNTLIRERVGAGLENVHGMKIAYDSIDVDLWSSSARITNLHYCSDSTGMLDPDSTGYDVRVNSIEIKYVEVFRMIVNKELYIFRVTVDGIDAVVATGAEARKEQAQSGSIDGYKKMMEFVSLLNVNRASVSNGSFHMYNTTTDFDFSVDSIYFSVHNLCYQLRDTIFTYNDSVYDLSMRNLRYVQPDGKYTLSAGYMSSRNAKGILVKNFRHVCNVPKERLAVVNGKVPAMWSDVFVEKFHTSPINVLRSVLDDRRIEIDSVVVDGGYVNLYKDNTYKPVKVQRPIQALMMGVNMPFYIHHVVVHMPTMLYQQKELGRPVCNLRVNSIYSNIINVRNTPGTVMKAYTRVNIANGGRMTMQLDLNMDKPCTWHNHTVLRSTDFSCFNPMVRPLIGIEVGGHLDSMLFDARGDSTTGKGQFMLAYHNISAKIIKGECPIKFLNDNAKSMNSIVKSFIPVSNPLQVGKSPKAYKCEATRNQYKPYFLHFVSPMFDGIKKTMLPGIYFEQKVKKKDHDMLH